MTRLAALGDRARREVDEGNIPSCQLALAREGELLAFETFGAATDDSRYTIWSCTKGLVAGAVWILMSERLLDVTKRVADYIPEFATNGKDVITVEQVLVMTAGFPRAPLGSPAWLTREGRLAAFERWRLNWEPGTRFEYHPLAAHWVLAELIERLSGTDYRRFIAQRITSPLGIPRFQLGVPADSQHDILDTVACGRPATPGEYAAAGLPIPPPPPPGDFLSPFNTPEVRALGVPGGGGVSRAAEIALYYQALLHNTDGMWDGGVLADVTGVIRNTFPDPTKHIPVPVNRSLGVVVAGDDGLGHHRMNFGRTVSPRTFGHDGAGGQIAWADPATGLSFCFLTDGFDAHAVRGARRGEDLSGLATACA